MTQPGSSRSSSTTARRRLLVLNRMPTAPRFKRPTRSVVRKRGLKGFITAHREIVTIFINGDPYKIERGDRTVAEILGKVNETIEGYVLLEEKNGPPMTLPPDKPVKIHGCEVFHTQTQSGGSS